MDNATPTPKTLAPCDVISALKKAESTALKLAAEMEELKRIVLEGRVRGGGDGEVADKIAKASDAVNLGWVAVYGAGLQARVASDVAKAAKAQARAAKAAAKAAKAAG